MVLSACPLTDRQATERRQASAHKPAQRPRLSPDEVVALSLCLLAYLASGVVCGAGLSLRLAGSLDGLGEGQQPRQGARHEGLGGARHALEQDVPAAQHGQQHHLQAVALADDDALGPVQQ